MKKTYALILAALVWLSILLQGYLTTGTMSNFFSFFTILSNMLIALSLTVFILFPRSTAGKFFSGLSVQSAIALYIFIVCLVYNTVLRGITVLEGWNFFVDTLLHVVNPVLYVIFWALFRTKGQLYWKDGIFWMFFPLAYLVYTLIRGSIVHWYPYPFLNVDTHGYEKVLVNTAMMIGVFMVSGLSFIFLERKFQKS